MGGVGVAETCRGSRRMIIIMIRKMMGKKRYLRSDGDVDAENVRSGDVSSASDISDNSEL